MLGTKFSIVPNIPQYMRKATIIFNNHITNTTDVIRDHPMQQHVHDQIHISDQTNVLLDVNGKMYWSQESVRQYGNS